ncbi:MAG TPA: hypothetical protein VI636_25505 [Candidatus Angelobacter sp.]
MITRTTITGSTIGSILLGLFLLRASSPTSSAPSGASLQEKRARAAAASLTTNPRQSVEGPWRASQNYFAGVNQKPCPATAVETTQKDVSALGDVTLRLLRSNLPFPAKDERKQRWCIPSGENVRTMIAIVPDPVQSPMQLQFDRSVEAIQLAAESLDYVIDRYWLPWDSRPSIGPADSSEAGVWVEASRRNEPGLLIFRWDGAAGQEQPATLYVFLVGDVATAGINGAQFDNAVRDVSDVCGSTGDPKCGQTIWVMGPTFSGSLSSLRRLADAQKGPTFVVYSGTVSSMCAIQKQGLSTASTECPAPPKDAKGANIKEFHTLVNSTEPAVRSLINYLKDQIDCESRPIALLSEASTTYGHTQRENGADRCYVTFSYPREISSLRNAYTGPDQAGAPTAANSNNVSSYLPFDLADRQMKSSDEPPDFSTQQGPLSKEAVLLSFAAELRRNHFKYIGIEGSNVLDVLFLARFLRKACPDMRLFVLNSDLLFERDPDNAVYIGTLALTTYPLIASNLEWTNVQSEGKAWPGGGGLFPSRLPFADQYEEGQYNATLLVLKQLMSKVPGVNLYEFREPFQSSPVQFDPECTVLPLWLTAVGNGGYWPIRIMPRPDPAANNAGCKAEHASAGPSPPVEMKDVDFSPAWKAILTMLCALSFLHIALLITASPLRSRFRDFSLVRAAPGPRFFFLNVATATLVTALMMLIAPLWCFAHPGLYLTWLKFMAPAFSAALFLTCLALYPRFWWVANRQQGFKELIGPVKLVLFTLAYIGVWAITIIGIYFWWRLFRDDSSHYGFFFAYRSVHLATGVSPFTPILPLLAALYCWGMLEVWRLRFHNQLRPRLATSGSFPGASREEALAGSINRTFLKGNYLSALVVVFAVWLFFLRPQHPFEIFEHVSFGIIYEVLFCLVVLLMLTGGFRLAEVWSELKKLLAELDQSRVRLSFSHLKEYSWSPIWQAGVQEIEWTSITRSLEVLRRIKACDPKPTHDFKKAIEDFENRIEEFRESRIELKKYGGWHRIHGLNIVYFKIQEQLAALLLPILESLEIHWNTHCCMPADDGDSDSDKQQAVVNCKPETPDPFAQQIHRMQQFVAQRYVAFIRGILAQIKRLIILVAILFSLVLISLNIYSFEPHQSLIWSFTALFAIIGLTVIVVLMQVNRDHILSRVTGTRPNRLDLDFYLRVAAFGAAPLLTLLATHFPSIGRFLLSLFQPGMEALK